MAGSVQRMVIFEAELELVLAPQLDTPAHRLPRTSRWVPLGNMTRVPGWMMSLAPDAITTSPERVCVPDQVSVPEMVPEVVSLLAETGAAGPTRATKRLVSISMTRR